MSYHAKKTSIRGLLSKHTPEDGPRSTVGDLWDAMNARYVKTIAVWKTRVARQHKHSLWLESVLTEKNKYIMELRAELELAEMQVKNRESELQEAYANNLLGS